MEGRGGDSGRVVPAHLPEALSPRGDVCPRCGRPDLVARYYGPCESCVIELGDAMRLVPREVAREAYVPKLNVVPNHVATKD